MSTLCADTVLDISVLTIRAYATSDMLVSGKMFRKRNDVSVAALANTREPLSRHGHMCQHMCCLVVACSIGEQVNEAL